MEITEESVLANVKASNFMVFDLSTDEGKAQKQSLLDMLSVDLSNPGNEVTIPYQLFVEKDLSEEYANLEFWGVVKTTAQWAVAMYQDGLNHIYEKIWIESGKDISSSPKIPITGVFDCDTSTATLLPAQVVRGTGVGAVDYWPLGEEEFEWVLTNGGAFGDVLDYYLETLNTNINLDEFTKVFQQRYEVNIPNNKFSGLPVPPQCEGIKPTTEVGTKTGNEEEGWAWPIFLGSIAGVTLIIMAALAFMPSKEEPTTALTRR